MFHDMETTHVSRSQWVAVENPVSYLASSDHSMPSGPSRINDNDDQGARRSVVVKRTRPKRLSKACNACSKSKRRCDGIDPCSNCYHASKVCQYTDATGRVIPAPKGKFEGTRRGDATQLALIQRGPQADSSNKFQSWGTVDLSPVFLTQPEASSLNLQTHFRKRLRQEDDVSSSAVLWSPSSAQSHLILAIADGQRDLHYELTCEITNLFFTHCQPQRLIIHEPSFSSDLRNDRVPAYLVNAVCSMGAIHCRNPRLQCPIPRLAGIPFAAAARAQMFDESGELVAPRCAATAQALCLLQSHEITVHRSPDIGASYFNLALRLMKDLGFQEPTDSISTTRLSPEAAKAFVEKETMRRVYWLIRMSQLLAVAFTRTHTPSHRREIEVCLPCSEFCFEMSMPSAPEYLSSPANDTFSTSEFGHVIRISNIFSEIYALRAEKAPDPQAVAMYEEKLQYWYNNLAVQFIFTEENLRHNVSLWGTNANAGPWCYFFMHVLHAGCVIAINDMKRSIHRAALQRWALDRLEVIVSSMGPRSRNSILMGFVLRIQNCGPFTPSQATIYEPDPTRNDVIPPKRLRQMELNLASWVRVYEELWGSPGGNTWSFKFTTRDGFHDIPKTPSPPPFGFFLSNPLQASRSASQQPSPRRLLGEMLPSVPTTSSEDTQAPDAGTQPGGSRPYADKTPTTTASRGVPAWLRDSERPVLVLPPLQRSGLLDAASHTKDMPASSRVESILDPPPQISVFDVDPRGSQHRSLSSATSGASNVLSRYFEQTAQSRTSSQLSDLQVACGDNAHEEAAHPSQPSGPLPPASTLPAGLPWLADELRNS